MSVNRNSHSKIIFFEIRKNGPKMLQVMVQNLGPQAKFSCRWIKLTRKGAIENLKWMLRDTALLKFVDSRANKKVENESDPV